MRDRFRIVHKGVLIQRQVSKGFSGTMSPVYRCWDKHLQYADVSLMHSCTVGLFTSSAPRNTKLLKTEQRSRSSLASKRWCCFFDVRIVWYGGASRSPGWICFTLSEFIVSILFRGFVPLIVSNSERAGIGVALCETFPKVEPKWMEYHTWALVQTGRRKDYDSTRDRAIARN